MDLGLFFCNLYISYTFFMVSNRLCLSHHVCDLCSIASISFWSWSSFDLSHLLWLWSPFDCTHLTMIAIYTVCLFVISISIWSCAFHWDLDPIQLLCLVRYDFCLIRHVLLQLTFVCSSALYCARVLLQLDNLGLIFTLWVSISLKIFKIYLCGDFETLF